MLINILYSFILNDFLFYRLFLFIVKLLVYSYREETFYFSFSSRYVLQQLSEQNDIIPMAELEYFTPSTRLLNSFLHELQFKYI